MTEGVVKLTLKPSVLIGLAIRRTGAVRYERVEGNLEKEGEREVKTWTTTRRTDALSELKESESLASECRRLVRSVAYPMAVGLVCPKDREKDLDTVIAHIKAKIAEANVNWTQARLSSAIVKAEIATDDQEAAKALTMEMSTMLGDLLTSLEECDVKKIRATVASMKGLDSLLPEIQSETLKKALQTARKVASTVVREVEKKGRDIESVKLELDLSPLDVARTMFVEVEQQVSILPGLSEAHETAERLAGVEQ